MFADKHDPSGLLTSADVAHIRSGGRDPGHVAYQVEILQGQRKSVPILRPATINDGIQQLQDYDPAILCGLHEQAAAAGRISSFVPASGSGTRLFSSLLHLYRDQESAVDRIRWRASREDSVARDALVVLENIRDFAIWEDLQRRGNSSESIEQILRTLFDDGGLRYHELPKGLIPFHRYDGFVRTAFAEHVSEAAALTTDAQKNCRIHFTVTPSHKLRFQNEWQRERPDFERALGVRFHIDFSEQSSATDTIAIDLQGNIRRDSSGHIIFRPGGHGALLENLAGSGGDVVLIKNIDNVARQELSNKIAHIRKQIGGLLLLVETQAHEAIRNLRKGKDPSQALQLLARQFGREPSAPLGMKTLEETMRWLSSTDQYVSAVWCALSIIQAGAPFGWTSRILVHGCRLLKVLKSI